MVDIKYSVGFYNQIQLLDTNEKVDVFHICERASGEVVAYIKTHERALEVVHLLNEDNRKRCYECNEKFNWLASDGRCVDCTRVAAEETQGGGK